MENKHELVLLGQILGRIEEMGNRNKDFSERLQRIEERLTERLDNHARRIGSLEVDLAKQSTRRGAISGAGAAGVVTAAIEVVRRLLQGA